MLQMDFIKMKKMSAEKKKLIQKWSIYGLILFIAYMSADLGIVFVREHFIPQEPPPRKTQQIQPKIMIDKSQYASITNRNLFSSQGFIPDPIVAKVDDTPKVDVPRPTSLPLNLIGTLVHSNPAKSVAAIEVKSKNMTGSYMPGAEIEGLAKIETIERGIVYFRNLNNGALEYAEMNKGNSKVSFDNKPQSATPAAAGPKQVQSLGNNTFRVKRADLNKHLNDLNSLLMQARALPNRDPNTGEINGYRLVDYQPDSIFGELGIPKGALIESANGEPITSIQAAMEMFNKLKKEAKISIVTEVNGSKQTFNYDIQQ